MAPKIYGNIHLHYTVIQQEIHPAKQISSYIKWNMCDFFFFTFMIYNTFNYTYMTYIGVFLMRVLLLLKSTC